MQTSFTTAIVGIVAVCSLASWVVWADGKDYEVRQAAMAYENCVQNEYHMTPIRWYEEFHYYPKCGN